jgi:hypothetical protein
MKISSTAFDNGQPIPAKYVDKINPPLLIDNVPTKSKSLALIVRDPDAPSGNFTHWIVWDIPPDTREMPEDTLPPGCIEGKNSAGVSYWVKPAPPSGTHRYFFDLYAIDTILNLPPTTTRDELEVAIANHVIDQAEYMGTFSA